MGRQSEKLVEEELLEKLLSSYCHAIFALRA